jgi:hypothetical protein
MKKKETKGDERQRKRQTQTERETEILSYSKNGGGIETLVHF